MDFTYKYKTVSIGHFNEIQEDIKELDRQGRLSHNERYRGYLDPDRSALPKDFQDARFIIIVARYSPLMSVNFILNGTKHAVTLPPESYCTGMTNEDWIKLIEGQIIKLPGYRIREVEKIPLKRLAVRSGLGKYGRNNICYVDEMGSFVSLHGFITDYKFAEDNWQGAEMMETCESCGICMEECPCGCIREENFVIDAPRCVTWYNERKGAFPEWLDPGVHNALLGCMRCQISCPANSQALEFTGRFEDVLEDDTLNILDGIADGVDLKSSACRIFGINTKAELEDFMPVLQRNLSVLIK